MKSQILNHSKNNFLLQEGQSHLSREIANNKPLQNLAFTTSLNQQKGSLNFAEQIISTHVDLFFEDSNGLSILDRAVIKDDTASVNNLLKLNLASLQFNPKTSYSYSCIQKNTNQIAKLAAQNGLISQYILSGKSDTLNSYFERSPYIFDLNSKTSLSSLHFASVGNSTEMITQLVEHGFVIDAKDKNGRTALHYAAIQKDKANFITLLNYGANLLEKDDFNVTPLDLLIYQSIQKDPLNVSKSEQTETLLMLITILNEVCLRNGLLKNYENYSELGLKYLAPASQIALLASNGNFSKKSLLLSSLIYFLANNFTLSKLALDTFIIAEKSISLFKTLNYVYQENFSRPEKSLKKIGLQVLRNSLIGFKFFQNYSFEFLESTFKQLTSLHKVNFWDTLIGEELYDEYESKVESITTFAKNTLENLRQFFSD